MKRILLLFISGAACFTISQPLLRIPLLNHLQNHTGFILFYTLNPLLTGILIAFSAGLFEEGFRFIFKGSLFKKVKLGMVEPIIFGLGHGLAEAIMVLVPYLAMVPLESLYMGLIERILAVILHTGLTVVIWNGFQLNQKFRYLGIAILVHGLVNSLIPILAHNRNNIILIESSLALIDILVIIYMVRSRKHYLS